MIYDVPGLEKLAKIYDEKYGVGCFEIFIEDNFWVNKQDIVGISIMFKKDEKRYYKFYSFDRNPFFQKRYLFSSVIFFTGTFLFSP